MIPETELFGFAGIDGAQRPEFLTGLVKIRPGVNGFDAVCPDLMVGKMQNAGAIAHFNRLDDDALFLCPNLHGRPAPFSKFPAMARIDVGHGSFVDNSALISSQLQAGDRCNYGCDRSYKADKIGSDPLDHNSIPSISSQDRAAVAQLVHTQQVAGSNPAPATSFQSPDILPSGVTAGARRKDDAGCAPAINSVVVSGGVSHG